MECIHYLFLFSIIWQKIHLCVILHYLDSRLTYFSRSVSYIYHINTLKCLVLSSFKTYSKIKIQKLSFHLIFHCENFNKIFCISYEHYSIKKEKYKFEVNESHVTVKGVWNMFVGKCRTTKLIIMPDFRLQPTDTHIQNKCFFHKIKWSTKLSFSSC